MPSTTGAKTTVTIREVASAANVSIATVSRVLRGHETVTDSTREKVQRAVEELRFTPSRLGRSLAERRHAANGIVFPDLSGPYYAEVVLGYEAVASDLERSVVILSTHGRAAPREHVLDLAGRVDGMVLMGRTVPDAVVLEVAARGVPVVVLARQPISVSDLPVDHLPIDSVNADNTTAAAELARHLTAGGARRPVFVGTPASSPDVDERWSSLHATFAEAGVELATTIPADLSEDEGRRVGTELLSAHLSSWRDGPAAPAPDAIICANDELALGLLDVLRTGGVRVPHDVAITGWDDVMAARWAGLSTVSQPMRDLGATAARRLDARIRGDNTPAQHIRLDTELVVRSTSTAPKRS